MSVVNTMPTYRGCDIAAGLGKTYKTFINIKPSLFAAGMPQPLDIPGNPVWLKSDIDTWLESRRRAPEIVDQPLSDMPAQAAAENSLELQDMPAVPSKRKRGRPSNAERSRLLAAQQLQGSAA